MKRLILIIALSFQCIAPAFAQQEHTLFNVNDKESVLQFESNEFTSYFFYDYDNPDNIIISALSGNNPYMTLYNIDNNLTLLDSLQLDKQQSMIFKVNNKLYGIGGFHNPLNFYLDSMFFYCKSINGDSIMTKKVFDSNGDTLFYTPSQVKVFLTKEKNIFIHCFRQRSPTAYHNRFIVIDTLGNVNDKVYLFDAASIFVQSSNIYTPMNNFVEHHNSFEYNLVNIMDSTSKSLFFDKQTLAIIDTVSYGGIRCVYPTMNNYLDINDSIGAMVYGFYAGINDYKNHNILHVIPFNNDTNSYPTCDAATIYCQTLLDFVNPDSIYYCYIASLPKDSIDGIIISDYYYSLHLVNFSIDGTLNYQYDFEFLSDSTWHYINGIRATSDGGVILSVQNNYNLERINNFIKFDPYGGEVSLVGMQSDKPILIAYPNPAQDNINFSCSELINEIEVFNLLGQKIYSARVKDKFVSVDVSSLTSGNYVAKLHTDKGTATKKFVVE